VAPTYYDSSLAGGIIDGICQMISNFHWRRENQCFYVGPHPLAMTRVRRTGHRLQLQDARVSRSGNWLLTQGAFEVDGFRHFATCTETAVEQTDNTPRIRLR